MFIIDGIKQTLTKIKNKLVDLGSWIQNKYRANRKKCRGTLITLALLILLTGLILGSFKSVDSLSQGVPINYTEGVIQDQTIYNSGRFQGLNTYYKTLPNVNFLISFDSDLQAAVNNFKSIRARVLQGTPLQIKVYAKVRLVPSNLKTFIENYGITLVDGVHQGWQIYIKEKIRNVVVQAVALFSFYQISNQGLASAINTKLIGYQTNSAIYYPFSVRVVSCDINYPPQTMQSNNTLGIKLLSQISLIAQLTTQLSSLNSSISKYNTSASNYQIQKATLDGQIYNRQTAIKIANSNWISAIQIFNQSVQNSTLMQKYLQIYFNSLYNITYRLDSLYPFKI